MTNFANWFQFDLRNSAAFDRPEAVDSVVMEKLGTDIQRQLRTTIDPGIDRKAGIAAGAIRVQARGNGFVIDSENPDDILKTTSQMASSSSNKGLDAKSITDLFESSSGVPVAQKREDGTTGLVYRQIELSNVFREQKKKAQESTVKQTVVNTVTNNIAAQYEKALDEVERSSPDPR